MPRLSNGRVPKYRKHRASGQAIVTIAGRGFYLGPYGTKASKIEYDRLICEWLSAGRPISFGAPADELCVVEVITQYLGFARDYYRKDGKPSRYVDDIKPVLRMLREMYGRTAAEEFGPLALKAVRQKMIGKGWARRYVNENVDRIRRMFKWAASEQLIPASVYDGLRTVEGLRKGRTDAPEGEPVQPVADSVVQAVLPHLPQTVCDMVRFQRATGCRPNEVCILRPCDVDRSDHVWIYRPSEHKTELYGRDRCVFIGPKAQSILAPYLLRSGETFCFSPQESERKRRAERHARRRTPLSCGNRPGTVRTRNPKRRARDRYDVASYRRAIHRACDLAYPAPEPLGRRPRETRKVWRARLTQEQRKQLAEWQAEHRWSPNQLRHSAATELRRRYGLEAAQVILGHSKADVTQIYAERDLALGVRVAAEVG
jgi:integrase